MIIKLSDTRAFDNTKCAINKTDPKGRWCVKSVDAVFSNYAMKISATTEEMQDSIGAPITCRHIVFSNENTAKLKHNSKQNMISCTINLIRLHK